MNDKSERTPANLDDLKWSIDQRHDVQRAALHLLRVIRKNPKADRQRKIQMRSLIAATFAMWRAAFLAGHRSRVTDSLKASQEFLEKVLTDNTVSFSFDVTHRKWTFRFYMDAARQNLKTLESEWPQLRVKSSADTQKLFDTVFVSLKEAIGCLERALEREKRRASTKSSS